MDWKRHSAIGVFTGIIVLLIFRNQVDIQLALIGLFTAFIFSLAPDIDHQNSKITLWLMSLYSGLNILFYFWKKPLLIYSLTAQAITIFFIRMAHRGPVHSLITNAVFTGLFYFYTGNVVLTTIAGVAFWSHLCADGIPLKLY